MNKAKTLILAGILYALQGCITTEYNPKQVQKNVQKPVQEIKQATTIDQLCNAFEYKKQKFEVNVEKDTADTTSRYEIKKQSFKSVSKIYENEIMNVQFHSTNDSIKPVVLYFPTLGGNGKIRSLVTEHLVNDSFDVACFPIKKGLLYGFEIRNSVDLIKETVVDARRYMDYMQTKGYEDFGVIGISYGGIIAELLAGSDDRIKGGVLAFTGGNLGLILSTTPLTPIQYFREQYMNENHITQEQLVKQIDSLSYCIEPLNYAHKINSKNFIFIYGIYDEIIPKQSTEQLYNALGKPETIHVMSKHLNFFYMPYVMDKSRNKFEQVFLPLDTSAHKF
jgi:cephalosporin-C deacetylase-like acetyl esterase